MNAAEMKRDLAFSGPLDPVASLQHIEIRTADRHVFIQSSGRNRICIGLDIKSQSLLWSPVCYRLDEQDTAFEARVSDASGALVRERSLNGPREPQQVEEAESLLVIRNARNALDVLPDGLWVRLDCDLSLHFANRLRPTHSTLDRSSDVRHNQNERQS